MRDESIVNIINNGKKYEGKSYYLIKKILNTVLISVYLQLQGEKFAENNGRKWINKKIFRSKINNKMK